jgi:predicted P-loop ATPase
MTNEKQFMIYKLLKRMIMNIPIMHYVRNVSPNGERMMKKIKRLWNVFLGTWKSDGKMAVQLPVKAPKSGSILSVRLEKHLLTNYEFRYNVLTDETEYKEKQSLCPDFKIVGVREQNSFCIEAQTKGINCWDRDVQRILNSNRIQGYHPFANYLETLPQWDGKERISALACRVSTCEIWVAAFRLWMLGLTAQWMGITDRHANSIAPVLVSKEQGRQKSTFCKSLMPPVLQRYYTDNIALTTEGQNERKLSELGLINLDEFDRFSSKKMAYLKNLMQMATPNIRKPRQKSFRSLPRIASFIATSNRKDLLTDPTGSRRFICVEIFHKIDCDGIEHEQIYAQLLEELRAGARYWLTSEEEHELQQHNKVFYQQSPMEEIFHACFRAPEAEEDCELLSATEIFKFLKTHHSVGMRGTNPTMFARMLANLGLERIHTKTGNVYKVIALA